MTDDCASPSVLPHLVRLAVDSSSQASLSSRRRRCSRSLCWGLKASLTPQVYRRSGQNTASSPSSFSCTTVVTMIRTESVIRIAHRGAFICHKAEQLQEAAGTDSTLSRPAGSWQSPHNLCSKQAQAEVLTSNLQACCQEWQQAERFVSVPCHQTHKCMLSTKEAYHVVNGTCCL